MDCKLADYLMTKYMDSSLTENESLKLNVHIRNCKKCSDDFMVYKEIAAGLKSESECLFEAPFDLEEQVMSKIAVITPDFDRYEAEEAAWGTAVGVFSMLFGLGVAISMYRAEIMAFLAGYPQVEGAMGVLSAAVDYSLAFVNDISLMVIAQLDGLVVFIDASKYGILALVIALIGVQYVLLTTNKLEA